MRDARWIVFVILFTLASCGQSDPIKVEPTKVDPANVDPVKILNDTVPPSPAKVDSTKDKSSVASGKPISSAEQLWVGDGIGGLATLAIYATEDEADTAFTQLGLVQQDTTAIDNLGEEATISIETPNIAVAFRRCSGIGFVLIKDVDSDDVVSYTQALDKNLKAALCP